MSNTLQAVRNSTINCDGLLEVGAIAVLVRKGGIEMIRRNFNEVFLAVARVVATDARSVMDVMFAHVGTRNSAVSTKISGSIRTASGLSPKPEKATMTLSGWAMLPPTAVT